MGRRARAAALVSVSLAVGACASHAAVVKSAAPASTLQSPTPAASTASASPSALPSSSRAAALTPRSTAAASVAPAPDCLAHVQSWTVAQLVARVLAVPVDMANPSAATALVQAGAGGVLLLGANPSSTLRTQLAGLHTASPDLPTVVMVDEEGGGIQHLSSIVGSLPWARDAAADETTSQVRSSVAGVARNLRSVGVDLDLAPVLDLNTGPGPDSTHPDGQRSFSGTADVAGRYGLAFVQGLVDGGVHATIKHFPGLGTATTNTDTAAASTAPYSSLSTHDLLPFESVLKAAPVSVMISNATTPGLTDVPASLSTQVITGLLRGQLGFSGTVLTDSLTATAISDAGYTIPQAAVLAVEAGADLVLYGSYDTLADATSNFQGAVAALTQAVTDGSLSMDRLHQAAAHDLALSKGSC